MNEQKNNEILLKAMMEKDQLSAIKVYCEERSKIDSQLEKALLNPDKTYEDCWSYIMEKAKKQLNNTSGHVMPSMVFGWAVHYFTEPNDVIEDEIGKIKATKQSSVKTSDSKTSSKTKKIVDSTENKAEFERISIFDYMDNTNNDTEGDTNKSEEEDDD